jgi:hypothetical protein
MEFEIKVVDMPGSIESKSADPLFDADQRMVRANREDDKKRQS